MNGFLIDTNVISEILRTAPDVNVAAWARRQAKQVLFLSVVSMGELRKGVTILPPSARRTQLEKSIEEQVPIWFRGRILPMTQTIAERWGELDGIRQLAGRPLNTPDGMIAATALEHDLTVVTRNVKDFAHRASRVRGSGRRSRRWPPFVVFRQQLSTYRVAISQIHRSAFVRYC